MLASICLILMKINIKDNVHITDYKDVVVKLNLVSTFLIKENSQMFISYQLQYTHGSCVLKLTMIFNWTKNDTHRPRGCKCKSNGSLFSIFQLHTWPWPWPWFTPHPTGHIGPLSDANSSHTNVVCPWHNAFWLPCPQLYTHTLKSMSLVDLETVASWSLYVHRWPSRLCLRSTSPS